MGRIKSGGRAFESLSIHIGLVQETKFADKVYAPRTASGYTITASNAGSTRCGGIALLHKENALYKLEELDVQRPNVLLFHLETGSERYFVVGCYIPPSDWDSTTLE